MYAVIVLIIQRRILKLSTVQNSVMAEGGGSGSGGGGPPGKEYRVKMAK